MIWCVCMIWQFIACCFECFEYCLSTTDLYSPSLNSILHLHGLLVSGYGGAGKPDKSAASWQRPPSPHQVCHHCHPSISHTHTLRLYTYTNTTIQYYNNAIHSSPSYHDHKVESSNVILLHFKVWMTLKIFCITTLSANTY